MSSLLCIGLASCTMPEVTNNPDGTSSTNLVVDSRISQAIATGQVLVDATAAVNPYAGPIKIGLSLASAIATAWGAIATFFFNKKNKQFKTVVKAIEVAPDNKGVKLNVEAFASKAGIGDSLHADVQKIVNGI